MINFFYDLETTGFSHNRHSIIQLAAHIEVDGAIQETLNLDIQPHPKAEITKSALKVNGKTEDEILLYPPHEEVYKELIKILGKYVERFDRTDKMYLVGYNNRSFDDHFLRKFFELNGDSFINSWFWPDTIDVMVLAAEYLKYDRPLMDNFKLGTVAKYLGIEMDPSKLHDALYDVDLTRAIYKIVTR